MQFWWVRNTNYLMKKESTTQQCTVQDSLISQATKILSDPKALVQHKAVNLLLKLNLSVFAQQTKPTSLSKEKTKECYF